MNSTNQNQPSETHPLGSLDEWEDDLLKRYPEPHSFQSSSVSNQPEKFRNYAAEARASVREFYRLNPRNQTVDFVRSKHAEYLTLSRSQMGIWEAMEYLNQLVDDSDPDIDLPQIEHLLQTAEAIRADGRPDWFIMAGVFFYLRKKIFFLGGPQKAGGGDTVSGGGSPRPP